MKRTTFMLGCLLMGSSLMPLNAQQTQLEKLDRGVVAVKSPDGVFISWRSLGTDDRNMSFDIYRDGTKINEEPLSKKTNFVDAAGSVDAQYVIKSLLNGEIVETSDETTVWAEPYKRISLQRPPSGVTLPYTVKNNNSTESYPEGQPYDYSPNDCSVGDLTGDGQYEIIVKWDPSNSRDNSHRGYTGNVYLDAYKLDGTFLWRIDLGHNIRAGAHYTQFMVYDFDGDGKAEIVCKTAPGTIDGLNNYVIMGSDDPTKDHRSTGSNAGIVMNGPEYLTVFNGETGAEISTVAYTPARGSVSGWGDNYANRSERYLAGVAYLDGVKPSVVMCRGYYTRSTLAAYDFDGTNLTLKWLHDSSTSGQGAYGEGNHSLAIGDVDGDGCDEIIYGSSVINNDGSLLYRTGFGHGDALHFGDLDPDIDGYEIFSPHEEKNAPYGFELRNAATGEVYYGEQTKSDIGRGIAADIDVNHRGHEFWVSGSYSDGTKINNVYNCKGEIISTKRPSVNFRVYWDGDLQDELLDGVKIDKWNGNGTNRLITFSDYSNAASCNTTKATPNLSADILGDWREEVILWDSETCSDLLLFTTTIPTEYKVPTLMHDHIYRMSVAWQNVAYNQPPHLGYYLGDYNSERASFAKDKNSGALTQAIELGYEIEPIIYTWKNADNVTATGLPEGIQFDVDTENRKFTISGSPLELGVYHYNIESTGSEIPATLTGTITCKQQVELTDLAVFNFDNVGGSMIANDVYGGAIPVNFVPAQIEGQIGQAISFPATPTDRRLEQEHYDQLSLGTKDFSIELWFRSEGGASTDWYLLHKGSHKKDVATGASGKWFGVQYKNGKLTFAIDDDITKSNVDVAATEYFDNAWHHLVCVRDTDEKLLKMYADGILIGQAQDNTGDISEIEKFIIGNCNVNFNTPFVGALDELRIYEGAMSAGKVRELYDNGSSTGIEDKVSVKDEFIVYPTRFTDTISLIVPKSIQGRTLVSIFAIDGVTILQNEYTVNGGEQIHLSGLDYLSSGSYLLTIEANGVRHTKKLIK